MRTIEPDHTHRNGNRQIGPRAQKNLAAGGGPPYMQLTQFARACGRVSVGGHPDKRPDSRQVLETDGGGWTSPRVTLPVPSQGELSPNSDWQPEAKPANPESPRGTQLKATTERAFFGLAGPPKTSTEEACPSLPGVRGLSPIDGHQSPDVSFGGLRRLHRAADRPIDSGRLHVASAPPAPEGDASHDRAHP